jgi:DNA-binding protein H-NS
VLFFFIQNTYQLRPTTDIELFQRKGVLMESNKSIEQLQQELADHEAEAQRLKAQIEKARQEQRLGNIEKVRLLMTDLGVTLADLKLTLVQKAEKKARKSNGQAAPKYRDPVTNKTWAARGAMPKWLKAYVGQGRNREEFLIDG